MTHHLFLVEAQVSCGKAASWPGEIVGGLLPVLVLASSPAAARQLAQQEILALDVTLTSPDSCVQELVAETLNEFVAERWPGCEHLFPAAETVQACSDHERVFLGPMFGYGA